MFFEFVLIIIILISRKLKFFLLTVTKYILSVSNKELDTLISQYTTNQS